MTDEQETMMILPWTLEASYRRLPDELYTVMAAEGVGTAPALIHGNPAAAALLDLDPAIFHDPAFPLVFSGHRPVAGFEALAMVYAGHQFGSYVPRLGDGRALLIAQLRNRRGELWDVQLKGAGRTPYSRFGDGRAVLRSCLREYLCSEAMAALGIPTTRALCVVATHEGVRRETVEPGAVLTRLAPSHVRFGHFEYLHHSGRPDLVRALADQVIALHFPELADGAEPHAAWFEAVVQRTARLIAAWQAAGFAHGVMNSDNMSILGLTIDYGPFGFLDATDPRFICNHSDQGGRYAFERQPAIALWNLQVLALALTSLVPVEDLRGSLGRFAPAFAEHHDALLQAKLGLPGEAALATELIRLMVAQAADYTLTFRRLGQVDAAEGRAAWTALFADQAAAAAWLERYRAACAAAPDPRRTARMARLNPKYVLRNWLAEAAIRAVEDRGDLATLDRILALVQAPFDEHPADEAYAAPPPEAFRSLAVSCSS